MRANPFLCSVHREMTPSADTLVTGRQVRFLRDGVSAERDILMSRPICNRTFFAPQKCAHRSCHGGSQFLKEAGRITQLPQQLECG
jgi:hypothetical protein